MHKSNRTAVTLAPLYFTTSGDFRCEASTPPPLYRTLSISKRMTVVGWYSAFRFICFLFFYLDI